MGACCSDRHRPPRDLSPEVTFTGAFKQPVSPLGASSSGVRFFQLVRTDTATRVIAGQENESSAASSHPDKHGAHWLGKDYAQAFDEAEFYNACHQLRQKEDGGAANWRLFDFLPSYHGIARHASCYVPGLDPQRVRMVDLLVFRSPLEGLARPRLLNVEVGPRTPALQFRRESEVGTVMFARREGIRVEGFMCPPRSVLSEEPGIDTKGWTWGDGAQRRAKRQAVQTLRVDQVLSALVDLRDAILEERFWPGGEDGVKSFFEQFLGPAEYSELALFKTVKELASLLRASSDVPTAQKWFGGSVAFLVEAGAAPPRTGAIDPVAWVDARVKLKLFGWSRSRVSDQEDLAPDERQDTELLWQLYKDSLSSILWEASRLYFQSFCTEAWTELVVELWEAPAKGDVLIGIAEMRLDEPRQQTRSLVLRSPNTGAVLVSYHGAESALNLRTSFTAYSQPSRFQGAWHVQVTSAANLPPESPQGRVAVGPRPDVFAVVTLRDRGAAGVRSSSQRTRMDSERPHPCWKEDFEFPTVSPGSSGAAAERLAQALGCCGGKAPGLAEHLLPQLAEEDSRQVALRQIAFMMEVRSGWQSEPGPDGSLLSQDLAEGKLQEPLELATATVAA